MELACPSPGMSCDAQASEDGSNLSLVCHVQPGSFSSADTPPNHGKMLTIKESETSVKSNATRVLGSKDRCIMEKAHSRTDNPCLAGEEVVKAEGALEVLRRQLEDYRAKNKRKFRFMQAGFVLCVLGLIALIVALSVVLTASNGLEGVCPNKYVITNQADLAAFVSEGCQSVDQLVLRGFVGNATFPGLLTVSNLTIVNSTYDGEVPTVLMFPDLASIGRSIRAVNNTGLTELSFPKLATISGELLIGTAPRLANLTLPSLTRMGALTIYANCGFDQLLFPVLSTVDNQVEISQTFLVLMMHVDPYLQLGDLRRLYEPLLSPLSSFGNIDFETPLIVDKVNRVIEIHLPMLDSAETISLSRVVGLEGLSFPSLRTLVRLELNLVSFDCWNDTCGSDDRPQLDVPVLRTLSRLDIQYCSELRNVTLPGLISIKEVSLVANANMTSFTLNFLEVPVDPYSMVDQLYVGWIRIMLNSRLSQINLGQLVGSTEGISIFNDDTLEEFIAPNLRDVSSLAIADTSRLRNITLPSLEEGALVIADNENLQFIKAPMYKGGSTLVIVRNYSLKQIELPELQNVTGSWGMSEVYWLVSSLLKNSETSEWEGMLLIDRNPVLYHVALPKLQEVTMCIFMRQPRMFTPALPMLSNNLVFMLIGNRNDAPPRNITDLPVPKELSLPQLTNNTKMIVYNTLLTKVSISALRYNDLLLVANNEQLATLDTPSLKWGAAEPAHVCIINNKVLCAPTYIAADFVQNTTADNTDRSCSINQDVNPMLALKNNGTTPAPTPEVACVPQNQTTAACCDQAANAVPNTGCTSHLGLLCSVLLSYLQSTPDRA